MNRLIIAIFTALALGTTQAEYTINIPLEQSHGGSLPSGTIVIKSTWVSSSPTYTSWTDTGDVYGCTNWSPESSLYEAGDFFEQTADDCKKDQYRYMQPRDYNSSTGEYRNIGNPVVEHKTENNITANKQMLGTLSLPAGCHFKRITTPWSPNIYNVRKTTDGYYSFIWNGVMWAGELDPVITDGSKKYILGPLVTHTEGDIYGNPSSNSISVEWFAICLS
jgi:hypothetical protein